MSLNRYARRVDTTHPQIVEDLRACGYLVEIIGKPVDIAVRHPTWPANTWAMMELKTPNKKDGYTPRKNQQKQTEFCMAHGVPFVWETEAALSYLRAFVRARA